MIAENGKVTLKGPVRSDDEKAAGVDKGLMLINTSTNPYLSSTVFRICDAHFQQPANSSCGFTAQAFGAKAGKLGHLLTGWSSSDLCSSGDLVALFFRLLDLVSKRSCPWESTAWANGVDVCLVISGFLITYLLLEECDAKGTIRLKRFYLWRVF